MDSNLASVSVTVIASNTAPVARDDAATLAEDGRVTLALLANDSDADGDVLALTVKTPPAHGVLVKNADSTYTYTPVANFSGEDSFTYVLSDGRALSNTATVRLVVTAVADAPQLVITDVDNTPTVLWRTGWESAANKNSTSTLVQQRELEGWTLVTTPDASSGGSNGFEVWSTGDKMMDAGNKRRSVSAASNGGANWLELNNSGGSMHQTLGLERTIDTIAGAVYTLSLDAAGRMGYSADAVRMGVYVDGRRIGGSDTTSSAAALKWQALSFSFTGKGGKQTLRLSSEATQLFANGRGMMVDNIALTQSLRANTGWEDTAISLSRVSAALVDTDGSEGLSVALQGLPVGATLSDGVRREKTTLGQTAVDITGWNLARLSLLPPADFNGTLSLRVVATATETSNGNCVSTTANLMVTVLPVNDVPVFTSTPALSLTLAAPVAVAGDSVFQAVAASNGASTISANFVLTERAAAYANEVGYYRVDDASGRIGTLLPGDVGYARAALDASRAVTVFGSNTRANGSTTLKLPGDGYVGFYLIQNSSISNWRSKNSANALGKSPVAFFSFRDANPDKFDHLRASFAADGKLSLKWEDLTGGGDKDFNDVVFTATGFKQAVTQATTVFTYQAKAVDVDGDTVTYSLAQAPAGATIDSKTGLLSWKAGAPGNYTFAITASDGVGGASTQTFALKVGAAPVASTSNSTNAASVVVKSKAGTNPSNCKDGDKDDKKIHYIVVNGGGTTTSKNKAKSSSGATAPTVNWSGTAAQNTALVKANWVTDFLESSEKQRSLAQKTGLVVRVKG